jgi:hypothetical protein
MPVCIAAERLPTITVMPTNSLHRAKAGVGIHAFCLSNKRREW